MATVRWKEGFLKALAGEIVSRKDYLGDETVSTIYFGGGTPSLMGIEDLKQIMEDVKLHYKVAPSAEITLEANPDDLNRDWLLDLRQTPVNRLSIGVQSFFDDDLHYLNRVHSGRQALDAIRYAQEAGFSNLTIDLIYGIPTLTDEKWRKNLDNFFSLDIPHLSAYSLTVEKKTPLEILIRKGKAAPVDEEQAVRHFKMLQKAAMDNNFIHYEISNFSREGYYSKHNSLYWLGGNYLGLGPSAHSYNGLSRQWNVASITRYISSDENASRVEEEEVLTIVQRYNEYVLTSLRTAWGCDVQHIRHAFGEKFAEFFLESSKHYLEKKYLGQNGSVFFLTSEGKLFTDGITADLFADSSL